MNLEPKSRTEKFLRWLLPYKEIGWHHIGEIFFRYQVLKTRWFNVYLHQLDAPNLHPDGCHDHPWWFVTVLLKGGYLEYTSEGVRRRYPGQILYRPAEHLHDVTTPFGRSWSLIVTGRKSRTWGHQHCITS